MVAGAGATGSPDVAAGPSVAAGGLGVHPVGGPRETMMTMSSERIPAARRVRKPVLLEQVKLPENSHARVRFTQSFARRLFALV